MFDHGFTFRIDFYTKYIKSGFYNTTPLERYAITITFFGFLSWVLYIAARKIYRYTRRNNVASAPEEMFTRLHRDILRSGRSRSSYKTLLAQSYGIGRGPTLSPAAVVLDEIQANGYRQFYGIDDAVKKTAQTADFLIAKRYITDVKALTDAQTTAWDMGQLVLLARCCCVCKYLSQENANVYIDVAQQACTDAFDDWDTFARSYILGYALCQGRRGLKAVDSAIQDLLSEEDSPWGGQLVAEDAPLVTEEEIGVGV